MDGAEVGDLGGTFEDQNSFIMEGADGLNDSGQVQQEGEEGPDEALREQDRFLPIANVARIMKNAVPKNGKIAKDAKECVQECVSEFISFITSEASERCHQEKRKTINGEDILFAMSTLGFDNYIEPLKQYLQKYRESIKGDKGPDSTEVLENLTDEQIASTINMLDPSTGSQGNIVYQIQPGSTVQSFNIG